MDRSINCFRRGIIFAVIGAAATLAACSKHPDKILADPVSSYEYRNEDCTRLSTERAAVQAQLMEHERVQQQTRRDTPVAVFMIGFLLWNAVKDDREEEIARAKGEIEAIDREAASKGCPITAG